MRLPNPFRLACVALLGVAMITAQACTTTGAGGPLVPAETVAQVELRARQAMFLAETAVQGMAQTFRVLAESNVLVGERAAQAQQLLRQANQALVAARAAYTVGEYATATLRATEVMTAVQQAAPLAPAPTAR